MSWSYGELRVSETIGEKFQGVDAGLHLCPVLHEAGRTYHGSSPDGWLSIHPLRSYLISLHSLLDVRIYNHVRKTKPTILS
jgi:hypothetical protein